ncbi:MAG TPA: hypothetical protein PKJ83_15070 [Cyclobacteriaceae bacterium]|nr:hypothetical protein [Cyclobacteriaceae bacterium]HPW62244.1 hypothetical protein [Cyclobacteriaceae bacterium]
MKILFLTCLLLPSITSFGKIWIVDSNAGSTAKDFTNLQAAHDGATAGDTLYLIGSPVNYITTKVTVTKKLIIIGPGYFLSENPDTQTNVASAFLNNTAGGVCEELEFAAGSEGSVLMGIEIIGRLVINTNNILIKRNHIRQEGACGLTMVTINGSNILFVQNFVDGNLNAPVPLIQVAAGKSGIAIGNNYFFHSCSGCGGGVLALESPSTSSLEVSNNIFVGGINVANAIVQNNFFNSDNSFTASASLVRNNIHTNGYLPAGNGNINSSSLGLRFVDTGSTDGRWKLKPTSPGLGAGFGGVDVGIFGGPEPYVLSGIPPIPTIYSLAAPAVGEKNTGLPIQIKVKSNN